MEGKLTQLLRVLTRFAVRYLSHHNGRFEPRVESDTPRGRKFSLEEGMEDDWSTESGDWVEEMYTQMDPLVLEALTRRRNHTVRAMVRAHVLRYPLLLSTSVERIEERIGNVMCDPDLLSAFHWSDFVRTLRRTEAQHSDWKRKVWGRALPVKPALGVTAKPVYLKEKKRKSGVLGKTMDVTYEGDPLSSSSSLVLLIDEAPQVKIPVESANVDTSTPILKLADADALSLWKSRMRGAKVAQKTASDPATNTVPDPVASMTNNSRESSKKVSISLRKKKLN